MKLNRSILGLLLATKFSLATEQNKDHWDFISAETIPTTNRYIPIEVKDHILGLALENFKSIRFVNTHWEKIVDARRDLKFNIEAPHEIVYIYHPIHPHTFPPIEKKIYKTEGDLTTFDIEALSSLIEKTRPLMLKTIGCNQELRSYIYSHDAIQGLIITQMALDLDDLNRNLQVLDISSTTKLYPKNRFLSFSQFCDKISEFKNLRVLRFEADSNWIAQGLDAQELSKLPSSLVALNLGGISEWETADINNADCLATLTNLKHLFLAYTNIGSYNNLPGSLTSLMLEYCQVDNQKGLENLSKLKGLHIFSGQHIDLTYVPQGLKLLSAISEETIIGTLPQMNELESISLKDFPVPVNLGRKHNSNTKTIFGNAWRNITLGPSGPTIGMPF